MTPSDGKASGGGERLQKLIAAAGVASRRAAETLIQEGRVTVNGRVVTEPGVKANLACDTVRVDGRRLCKPERSVAILVNKPRGYLSTCSDPQKRPIVLDLVPQFRERLFPVGRLDFDSEGLLILTNDGELAHAVTHPRNSCPKVYRVKVRGKPPDPVLHRVSQGVSLAGRRTRPSRVSRVRSGEHTWLEITLTEGRKNQIRRVFKKVGFPVLKLKRITIGGIRDRGLIPGGWRRLTPTEILSLKRAGMQTGQGS